LAEKWAQQLVDSYAMSTREAKQYLSSVQDLLVPMGMASDQAGKMSSKIVKLAADLGSFNNMPTARVMADIQSGLVGNYETMKKYGVVLNATIVQEKALAMGLASTKNELTAGQKAHAAYTLMVEGSKAAIGDMARTQDDYANQMKQIKAHIEDLSASIGTFMIPTLSAWAKALNEVAKYWKEVLNLSKAGSTEKLLEDRIIFTQELELAQGRLVRLQERLNIMQGIGSEYHVKRLSKEITETKTLITMREANLRIINQTLIAERNAEKAGGGPAEPLTMKPAFQADYWLNLKEYAEKALNEETKRMNELIARERETEETLLQIKGQYYLDDAALAEERLKEDIKKMNSTAEKEKESAADRANAYREMYRDVGSLAKANYELQLELLKKQRDEYLAVTGDMATVAAWYADMKRELILQKNEAILQSTTDLTEGMAAAWENYIYRSKTQIEELAELSIQISETMAQGIGDAYAQAIIYGKNMTESFQDLTKKVAASIISSLIQIGIQKATQWVMAQLLNLQEATSRMATLAAETYGGAFAATAAIPIVGPALAPGVAAAALATMLSGSAAAGAAGGGIGAAVATYHEGGIVGRGSRPTRLVSSDVFAGAQRAHTGLAPDEKPVIVKNDEGIFTPAQMAVLGAGLGLEERIENHVHVYLDGKEQTKAQVRWLKKDGILLKSFQRAIS